MQHGDVTQPGVCLLYQCVINSSVYLSTTCDVRESEALASEGLIRVEFNPHVVLRGDVRSRDGRATCSVAVQVLVGADGDPVQTAAV